jgi:predicted acetyltransferase
VTSDITMRRVAAGDRPLMERLWQYYRYDLSEFRDSYPDADGLFTWHWFPRFFEPDAAVTQDLHAFLVLVGDRPAGFAMADGLPDGARSVYAFFVTRAARRTGVGRAAARRLLAELPGRWEIGFQEENPAAARFWRRLAAEDFGEHWREETRPVPGKPHLPDDVFILLDNSRTRPPRR